MDRIEELTEEINNLKKKVEQKRWPRIHTFLVFWTVVLGVYVMFITTMIGIIYKILKHLMKEIEKYFKEGKTC
jgi:predicted PurR-regulated permease PerM